MIAGAFAGVREKLRGFRGTGDEINGTGVENGAFHGRGLIIRLG
jgi:hypothetical protein